MKEATSIRINHKTIKVGQVKDVEFPDNITYTCKLTGIKAEQLPAYLSYWLTWQPIAGEWQSTSVLHQVVGTYRVAWKD